MIPGYPKEESAECPSLGIESLRVANQRHEDLLGHVLSYRRIAAHMQSKPVNRWMFAPVEKRKRFFVTGQHPPNQAVVGHR
jgi:hypothetical protein